MKYFSSLFFICYSVLTIAQKYDATWVVGTPNTIYKFDSASLYPIDSFPMSQSMYYFLSNGCMSDKDGNLLYMSNGLQIRDRNDNLMEGGDQFRLGAFDTAGAGGYDFRQSPLSLPMPCSDSLYYIFYEAFWNSSIPEGSRLYYGIIDMNANGGLGKVISLNNILIDTFITDGGLGACKHANGIDWWLVKPKFESNEYFKFLVKANGIIEGPFAQSIGLPSHPPDYNSQLVFSPAGDKMFYTNGVQKGGLFDFDRCTGLLSNPRYIWKIDYSDTAAGIGASFSPSGRFLYVTGDSGELYQLDTYSRNVDSSKIILARFYQAQNNLLDVHQLAPNSKIYIQGYNSPTPLTVINYPDSFGLACGLDTFAYSNLPWYTYSIPNFPFYRTLPARVYQADAGHDTTICIGDTVKLGVTEVDSVVYQWQSDASLLGSTDMATLFAIPTQTTSYYLTITDTVPRGYSCNVRTDTITVQVAPLPCVLSVTDINETAVNIKLHPNPAKDYTAIYYNIPVDQQAVLNVFNQLGELVVKQPLSGTANSSVIQTNQLADGVYNYSFILNQLVVKRDKFVVMR